ncbi:MAG: hypothetical protein GEU88_00025 [Solirubrobacterales bacterium]|nr:hypothetical protein [Solirubrobacterales bacterium]
MTAQEERRVAGLLADHGPLASPALRARVEAEIAGANERRRLRVPILGVALAGAAATLLVALALFLPGVLGGEAGVGDAHGLSAGGPTAPAPAPQAHRPELLAASLDGIAFPDWEREFGWEAFGQRSDELDGRRTETVFYEHEGHTIAYTIVSGAPLEPPADAKPRRIGGVELYASRDSHGHDIVSFERQGKTCVLSGHVEERSTLLELAAWRGDGQIGF